MFNFDKIIISLLFVLLGLSPYHTYAGIHSYKNTSVLAEGKFVKIKIEESGVYKLTFDDLKDMGLNNPADVKIFGYGGALLNQNFLHPKIDDLPEVAIHMEKGSDGIFNTGDYILFYAQGVNSWKYDAAQQIYVHTLNHYSTHGYYFVTCSNVGTGRKIEMKEYNLPSGGSFVEVNDFIDFAVHEKELVSLVNSGKVFYGETFGDILSLDLKFSFPNIVIDDNSVRVRLDVAANSTAPSTFNLSLNSKQTKSLSIAAKSNDHYEKGKGANGFFTFKPEADIQNFKLTYDKSAANSRGYLNYLEVNAKRALKMTGDVMRFQNPDNLGNGTYNKFILSNATSNVQIWDITDHTNISRINAEANNGTLSFYDSNQSDKAYLALNPAAVASFPKPEVVGDVPNQNLHGMLPADMLIITHPNFLSQAERLANEHNARGEITVEAVTTEQVYNEFSSGTPDATAYRWVLKMLYDRANESGDLTKRPSFLLLFGRGSYDNRKILRSSGEPFVLTYQADNSLVETNSYVTDDYFAFLKDTDGDNISAHSLDIGVGRFPVSNLQEATDVVTKTINYMKNENRGIWKNQLCFLADDGDNSLHAKQAETVASSVSAKNPAFQVTKIYLDAYQQIINASGETYPVARTQFHNSLRNGMFVLDFTGHAGVTGWTNEQILTTTDVRTLSNKNLPLWVAVTCNFLQFDLPSTSAGERVLLNPIGGGIGIFSATRPVYASQNLNINKEVNHFLFLKENGEYLRVGEVFRRAKNKLGNEINKLSYVYMGDPSVRLNYPDKFGYKIITDKINGVDVQGNDTLRALSVARIEGHIADENNNLVDNFNGVLNAIVYDKVQSITTLNNDKNNGADSTIIYKDRLNKLFSGAVQVNDGQFELVFMLPKDIKYNYGTGRINYYASCENNGYEAQGYFENFYVGGTNPDVEFDEEGPDIQMYLNSPTFKSGDKVNETPLFIAHVNDISGINQVGNGIGHDITLIVDEDSEQSYILNDFYHSAESDYTQGTVRFKLPELRNGKHTLTFKVWDLQNNSSSQIIDFEVVKGLEPVIFDVYNYPNPVKASTKFVIQHDRPESVLDTKIDIFDLAGRLIWTMSQSTLDEITWNVTDSEGRSLPTGIYLYRVSVSLDSKTAHSKINKLIVIE
ncbi:MAG TPA: type IX secretion system sortase PorU [Paludibacter sp.]|nr:MAG: Peptidase family C25 [Bacteroidetes bacterium ADurb.Bin174]HQB28089.1 type IX secretion system sortase PorU [Paludibacter sp.]